MDVQLTMIQAFIHSGIRLLPKLIMCFINAEE